jgi:hypothetical protein
MFPRDATGRSAPIDVRATPQDPLPLIVGAIALLASGWVHYYLYFRGGYRDIAPDSFAGITISRAFAVNAIAGPLIAWALVVSLRFRNLALPAALAGLGFAAATLAAYLLSRTVGLLGFEDNQFNWEAGVAFVAEVVAIASLGSWLISRWTHRRVDARNGGGARLPADHPQIARTRCG